MMLKSVILPVILVVLCCIVPVENPPLSDITCPTPLKITPRDLNCSNNEVYHIVRDPRSDRYIEGCFMFLMVPPGNVTTLDISGNINTEECDEETFQRHPYRSNTQCACNETKGQCNKTGQIVASNGNTTHDRTCRCDFRRGYKISTTPSNECFCNSSSEDCTCIKEECKMGYRLSPDYECVPENSTTNYTCKDYISDDSTTESVPDSDTSVSLESTTKSVPGSDTSVSLESTTESVPDSDTLKPERMPTGMEPWYRTVIIAIYAALVFIFLGALIFGKKKMIEIICAPMRICCKKCRPGRNGSAATDNEGKPYVPVQVTENDDVIEISPLIKVDMPAPSPTNNNQRQHTVI